MHENSDNHADPEQEDPEDFLNWLYMIEEVDIEIELAQADALHDEIDCWIEFQTFIAK